MSDAAAFARAAVGLVGSPFRLHGRNPATGLDCVGVVVAALRQSGGGGRLPTGYRLRTGDWPGMDIWAEQNGFEQVGGQPSPGDVLLSRPGPGQLHLAVVAPDPARAVEAHAGLRKVVLSPLPPAELTLRRWRLYRHPEEEHPWPRWSFLP